MKKTIVIGKFYPLQIGHMSLIQLAHKLVGEKLVILVDNHESYSISLNDRVDVIKRTYPHMDVRGIEEYTLQEPSESENFWEYWINILNKYVPEGIDEIIGSMDYVKILALKLNCKYTLFDKERLGINISASLIRENIKEKWEYLAPESKSLLTKSVALMGAESCGKSTLCKKLAKKYETVFVPEYGRSFVEHHGQDFNSDDLVHISQVHLAHAETLKLNANHVFFYDTEAIITQCWHDFFFKYKREEIDLIAQKQRIDLYILVPVQDSWVKDDVRYHEEMHMREKFYQEVKQELIKHNKKFVELKSKGWDDLFKEASQYIEELL